MKTKECGFCQGEWWFSNFPGGSGSGAASISMVVTGKKKAKKKKKSAHCSHEQESL